MHKGGIPQSSSQAISVPSYVRKKALNPGRKTECTRPRMMGKFRDVQFGIRFSTWNVGSMSGKWSEISETLKRLMLIFAVCRKQRGKEKGLK